MKGRESRGEREQGKDKKEARQGWGRYEGIRPEKAWLFLYLVNLCLLV